MEGYTVIEGREQTRLAGLIVLGSALKLEVMGLKRRGRSAHSIVKETFGLKGSKLAVYNQYKLILEEMKNAIQKPVR